MTTPNDVLASMIAILEARSQLDERDHEAILSLPHTVNHLEAGTYIVREGEASTRCSILLEGFACRHKIVGDDARQIVGIYMAGDFIDLHSSILDAADENVQTLTAAKVAFIPIAAIEELTASRPAVAQAMWAETLVNASRFAEWMANIGRRNAKTRMAHLLCELAVRQSAAGLGTTRYFELPVTQEQLADALSLTPVHVNRTLRVLEAEGLISRDRRAIEVRDWERLERVGDFDTGYLHLRAQRGEQRVQQAA
ncbi:MAG: Crp/Fnr family transcriptional regulator [Pseudomonadota bacterium]|nr:Crp/Fnr family transcriptional regulator [Pseudomonadota bacterium]